MTRDESCKLRMASTASMERAASMGHSASMGRRERTEHSERMERTERTVRTGRPSIYAGLAPTIRSVFFTLIAWVAAAGFVATIGLGALSGCASDRGEGENHDATGQTGTEHASAENTETVSDTGEESGETLALDQTYDTVRIGARLILRYDAASNAFVGTVQNTTEDVLNSVRIEVHLSNGTELGPTTPVDLAPGQIVEVTLTATEETFTGWTPHAEVGTGEHGEDGVDGEHGAGGENGEAGDENGEGGGEHGSGGEVGGEHGSGGEESGEHGGGDEGSEGDEGDSEHDSGG